MARQNYSRTITFEELSHNCPAPTLRLRMPAAASDTSRPANDYLGASRPADPMGLHGQPGEPSSSDLSGGPGYSFVPTELPLNRGQTGASANPAPFESAAQRPPCTQPSGGLRQKMDNMFLRFNEGLRREMHKLQNSIRNTLNETQANPRTTDQNKKTLRESREILKQTFLRLYEEQAAAAERALDSMTAQQQEDFLAFWDAVGDFLVDTADWIGKLNEIAVDLILKGEKIEMDVVRKIFDEALKNLESISNELKSLYQ